MNNDVPEWRAHPGVSTDNILPARTKHNAPPPNRLGVVDHEGYGLLNNGPKAVNGYLNAMTAFTNSIDCYSDEKEAGRTAIEQLILTQVGMKKGVKMFG